MDQFEIIWILVIVIGALNYGLNAYQKGFRRLLKWDVIFLIILNTLMFVPLSLIVGLEFAN
jgi:ABC-type sulfate transport system permease subunit